MAAKPGYLWSLFTMKCPRCRKGPMFSDSNPWNLKNTLKMPTHCTECNQLFELEVGFWYGTAYISYLITVLFCVFNFILLVVLQPWFMRLSRAMYLYFFVSYNADYKNAAPKTFDYTSEAFFLKGEADDKHKA